MRFNVLRPFLNRFRRRSGAIYIPERFEMTTRVHLIARERGKKVGERESSNVVVNDGRTFLRGLISASSYPDAAVPPAAGAGALWEPTALTVVPPGNVQSESAFRPRYIALGTGGTLQNVTPPGAGAYTEVAARLGLERPVYVNTVDTKPYYVGQIQGQDLSDSEDAPDDYTIRFRRIFTEDEISYAGSNFTDAPFAVPLSEALLLSSEYDDTDQSTAESSTPDGVLAYNTFATLNKTPLIQVEVIWEWRL